MPGHPGLCLRRSSCLASRGCWGKDQSAVWGPWRCCQGCQLPLARGPAILQPNPIFMPLCPILSHSVPLSSSSARLHSLPPCCFAVALVCQG